MINIFNINIKNFLELKILVWIIYNKSRINRLYIEIFKDLYLYYI